MKTTKLLVISTTNSQCSVRTRCWDDSVHVECWVTASLLSDSTSAMTENKARQSKQMKNVINLSCVMAHHSLLRCSGNLVVPEELCLLHKCPKNRMNKNRSWNTIPNDKYKTMQHLVTLFESVRFFSKWSALLGCSNLHTAGSSAGGSEMHRCNWQENLKLSPTSSMFTLSWSSLLGCWRVIKEKGFSKFRIHNYSCKQWVISENNPIPPLKRTSLVHISLKNCNMTALLHS